MEVVGVSAEVVEHLETFQGPDVGFGPDADAGVMGDMGALPRGPALVGANASRPRVRSFCSPSLEAMIRDDDRARRRGGLTEAGFPGAGDAMGRPVLCVAHP